jgi:hypothetical protein
MGPVPACLSSAHGGELIAHSLAVLLGMRTDEHCPYGPYLYYVSNLHGELESTGYELEHGQVL